MSEIARLNCGCKMFACANARTKSTVEHCKTHRKEWDKFKRSQKRKREVSEK